MEQNEDLTHCWQKHKTEQHFKGTDICHMIQQLLLCISSKKNENMSISRLTRIFTTALFAIAKNKAT